MPTLILEHSDLSGADRLATLLRDRGHRLDVRRLHAGDDLPSDLDGIDAVVTCGGEVDPTDEAGNAWMAGELELLRAAHESGRTVIGFCLGSQLLARALGGEVGRLDDGIELGWHSVTLTPAGRDDPVFAGIGWDSVQLHHHRWHVSAAPPEASILASSERTPAQAWRCGMRSYGFQYHLEAQRDRLASWVAADPDGVREAGTSTEALDAGTDAHWEDAARLADHIFDRIATIVMPLDRRVAGVARDLHH